MGRGGSTCSVACCRNTSANAKKRGITIHFHGFPKDLLIRKQWITKCRRLDKFNPHNGRICSVHFTEQDYEDQLKASLMGLKPLKLKKDAVPSLFLLPSRPSLTKEIPSSTEPSSKKIKNEVIEEVLVDDKNNESAEGLQCDESEMEVPYSLSNVEEQIKQLEEEKNRLDERIKFLKKCREALEFKNKLRRKK